MAIRPYFMKNKQKMLFNFFISSSKNLIRLTHQLAVTSYEKPNYPPIIDTSKEGIAKHKREMYYDRLKSLPTVEQKLHSILNYKSMYERVHMVGACLPIYAGIPFQYYITRTHMIHGFPEKLTIVNVDDELSSLKDSFCEILARNYFNPWQEEPTKSLDSFLSENHCGSTLVCNLLSECFKKLAPRNDYLLQSTFQQLPEVSSFWWHGNFKTKGKMVCGRNLLFNFKDIPVCAIRTRKPLLPILSMSDRLCVTDEVTQFNYRPTNFGIPPKRYTNPKSSPGSWFGDPCDFPLLQVYSPYRMSQLISKIEKFDLQTIEDGLGVMSSFGWLNSVAHYQGFTPFHDLTYPLVGHTILTNGQDWTFYTYQLNTIAFHEDVDTKDRRNICWSSGKMRLFDAIEDGQVKGINDDVFCMLLRLFLYRPQMVSNVQLKPYLGVDTRSEEEVLAMRKELHKMVKNFKTSYSFVNDIPLWQKIYKFHKDAPPSPTIRME